MLNHLIMRGATAYEFQWRRLGIRLVHLTGGNWRSGWHKPWQRLSFQWFGPGPDYSAQGAAHWPRSR
jgi:hypothetical protein